MLKTGPKSWIEASYNPVLDGNGKVAKIVKFAIDITEKKLRAADAEGQLDAISRSQAVIEFTPDGTILTANKNFLETVGYRLEEIQGKHHRMFCDKTYTQSAEYGAFWQNLYRGEFHAGKYQRFW